MKLTHLIKKHQTADKKKKIEIRKIRRKKGNPKSAHHVHFCVKFKVNYIYILCIIDF